MLNEPLHNKVFGILSALLFLSVGLLEIVLSGFLFAGDFIINKISFMPYFLTEILNVFYLVGHSFAFIPIILLSSGIVMIISFVKIIVRIKKDTIIPNTALIFYKSISIYSFLLFVAFVSVSAMQLLNKDIFIAIGFVIICHRVYLAKFALISFFYVLTSCKKDGKAGE